MSISVSNITNNNISTEPQHDVEQKQSGSIFDCIDKYSFDILKSPVKKLSDKVDETHKDSRLWNFVKGLGDVADFIFSTEGLLTMGATILALKGINKGATKLWGTKGGAIAQLVLKTGFISYGGILTGLGMGNLGKVDSTLEDVRHAGEQIGTGLLFVTGGVKMKMNRTDIASTRKNIPPEEIKAQVTEIYQKTFDEMNIPENSRPQLEFVENESATGGSYIASKNVIEFNLRRYFDNSYKSIEEIICHEAEHARQTLLRSRLDPADAQEAVKNILLERIRSGEPEKIILEDTSFASNMMTPPRMSAKMRAEFAKFAEEELFTSDAELKWGELHDSRHTGSTSKYNFDTQIKNLLNNNPDFVEKYGEKDAVRILNDYIFSLLSRYAIFSRTQKGVLSSIKQPELSQVEKTEALESLKDAIECREGNLRNQLYEDPLSFNQYHLSSEEIAARNTAAKMEKANLEKMPRNQANIDRIRVLDFEIKYNEAGRRFYQLYTESLNKPEKAELAQAQKEFDNMYYQRLKMKNELNYLYDFEYSPITGFATAAQEK